MAALLPSKWIVTYPGPKEQTYTKRLVCFHWAGGHGHAFRSWAKQLQNAGIDLMSIMLPGRMSRIKDPFIADVKRIAEILMDCFDQLNTFKSKNVHTIFFGHSYGGIIAFELACLLKKSQMYSIDHLIISSTNNPHRLSQRNSNPSIRKFHQISEIDLFEEIMKLGGLQEGNCIVCVCNRKKMFNYHFKTYMFVDRCTC